MKLEIAWVVCPKGQCFFFQKKWVGDIEPKYLEDEKQDWGPGSFEGTCSFTYKTTPR